MEILQLVFDVSPLSWAGIFSSLLTASLFGFERQVLGKPVGIRTSVLIILSVYIFMGVSHFIYHDQVRIIGQIITGVGFLGGGVIIAREGMVQGMTSAATIWILTAIGVLYGLEHYLLGIKLTIVALIVLFFLFWLEKKVYFLGKGRHSIMNS
jgi:putative Mg2+ transporter-C (MgtC) family protein